MERTKRLVKPIVLLALTWAMFAESGCMAGHDRTLPPTPPSPTAAMPSGAPGGADDPVGFIGGTPITRKQLVDQLLATDGAQTLRTLMLRIAVEEEAQAKHIQVTDEDIDRELRKRIEGYDSAEQFYADMKSQLGMSPEEVRKDAKYQLELEQLAILPVQVPEADIDRYLTEHKDEFGPRTRLKLSHIVTDNRKDAENLLDRLKQGEEFAALASRYSTDGATSSNGGSMGWIDTSDPLTDAALLKAVRTLQVGEATGPVHTQAGYEIIRLDGREEKSAEEPVQARNDARKALALEHAQPMADLEQSLLDKYGAQVLDETLKS